METILHILSLVLLFAGCLFALASLVLGLPGTFLIVGIALIYGWSTDFAVRALVDDRLAGAAGGDRRRRRARSPPAPRRRGRGRRGG